MEEVDVTSDSAFMSFMPGRDRGEDDKRLEVEFFVEKKLMGLKSKEAKKPIYEDREYVRIVIKGQKYGISVQEANDAQKERFPNAYHRFLLKKPALINGTPIEMLPGIGPSQADHLKSLALRTTADLANVNNDENVLRSIGMGARDLVARAKAFEERTSTTTVQLQEQNAALLETIEKMNQRMAAIESAKPAVAPVARRPYKRRGRKPAQPAVTQAEE